MGSGLWKSEAFDSKENVQRSASKMNFGVLRLVCGSSQIFKGHLGFICQILLTRPCVLTSLRNDNRFSCASAQYYSDSVHSKISSYA